MIVQLYDNAPIHYCAQPMTFDDMYSELDEMYRIVISNVGVTDPCEKTKLADVFAAIDHETGKNDGLIHSITFKQGKQKIKMSFAYISKYRKNEDVIYEIEATSSFTIITGVFRDDIDWCSNSAENKKTNRKRKATGKITRK